MMLPFEELMSDMCGNLIASIRSCISDWETDDETDYQSAMVVYKRIIPRRRRRRG